MRGASQAVASLCGRPRGKYWQFILLPKHNSVAFADVRFLDYIKLHIVHCHMTFRGLQKILRDFYKVSEATVQHLHEQLFHVWLIWQSITVLVDAGIDLSELSLRLDRHATPGRYPTESVYGFFGALEVRLRDVLLRHHLRAHTCSRCRVGAVGVDGAQSVTSKVCQYAGGDVHTFGGVNVQIDLGCQDPEPDEG